MHHGVEIRIADIAGRQRQLITNEQLIGCGLSRPTIHRWTRSGRLVRITRGVYLFGAVDLTLPRLRVAAVLAYGPSAAVTHLAGIQARGYTRFRSDTVDVTSPNQSSRILHGCRVHKIPGFGPAHHDERNGDRLATLAWNITDLGTQLTPHQIAHVIHQGQFHERLEVGDVERLLRVRGAIPGAPRVREAVQLYLDGSAGTRSFGEDDWLEIAEEVWPRAPLVNTVVPFRSTTFELDLFWPSEGCAVEVDNFQHGRPRDAQHDALIDHACAEAGITLLRVWGRDARRLPRLSRERLRSGLERASARSSPARQM